MATKPTRGVLRINEPVLIGQVFESCANDSAPSNATHAGFDFVSRFDLSRLPKKVLESRMVTEWPTFVLEDWAEVDIGGCARFGMRCLKQSPWVKWEDLRVFLSGGEMDSDAGSVLDRTFSALRVWAIVRPSEMKAWIATEPDPELRKALTWLLEHPWGTHPEP
jgi:hypothetical protein